MKFEERELEEQINAIAQFQELHTTMKILNPLGVRWCVKRNHSVPLLNLDPEECVKCNDFVCNDGVCDPI